MKYPEPEKVMRRGAYRTRESTVEKILALPDDQPIRKRSIAYAIGVSEVYRARDTVLVGQVRSQFEAVQQLAALLKPEKD